VMSQGLLLQCHSNEEQGVKQTKKKLSLSATQLLVYPKAVCQASKNYFFNRRRFTEPFRTIIKHTFNKNRKTAKANNKKMMDYETTIEVCLCEQQTNTRQKTHINKHNMQNRNIQQTCFTATSGSVMLIAENKLQSSTAVFSIILHLLIY